MTTYPIKLIGGPWHGKSLVIDGRPEAPPPIFVVEEHPRLTDLLHLTWDERKSEIRSKQHHYHATNILTPDSRRVYLHEKTKLEKSKSCKKFAHQMQEANMRAMFNAYNFSSVS